MVGFLGANIEALVLFLLLSEAAMLSAFLVGAGLARRRMGSRHHYIMLAAFLVDEAVFKPLMTARGFDIWGGFPWPGTGIAVHMAAGNMLMLPKGRTHRWLGRAFVVA